MDQRIGIQRAADKANRGTLANSVAGVRCKYDAPSLLCGAPSIMLCGELQPVGANMPILIRGAEAPCAKGLLNPGDDAHHRVVHRVAGECLGLEGPWRLLVFLVDEVDGRGGALVGWHGWKRWMCYRLSLSPPCIAHRLCGI